MTASGELSWDMIRDALIREVTFGGATCPTEEVCCPMAAFLQRLPLPRLVHFLDMILPQMVPVQSPCHSGRRRFASSYRVAERLAGGERGVEYTLNVTKLFWSRSASCMLQSPGITNHSCFWLLLCSQIVPPSLSKVRLDPHMTSNGFKWGCAQAIQSVSVSGVELATTKVY